jgi:hypothetical protein
VGDRVRFVRRSGPRKERERRERCRQQTAAKSGFEAPVAALVRRHGEQRAYGMTFVCALAPIVTVQVPPSPGVLARLL